MTLKSPDFDWLMKDVLEVTPGRYACVDSRIPDCL